MRTYYPGGKQEREREREGRALRPLTYICYSIAFVLNAINHGQVSQALPLVLHLSQQKGEIHWATAILDIWIIPLTCSQVQRIRNLEKIYVVWSAFTHGTWT